MVFSSLHVLCMIYVHLVLDTALHNTVLVAVMVAIQLQVAVQIVPTGET